MSETEETSLATREEAPLLPVVPLRSPAEEIAFQSECANALMAVVNKQKGKKNPFVVQMKDKQFLTFESWQTIARLNNCDILGESTTPILDDEGRIIAYDSWATVVDRVTGRVVSRANMECGMDAFPVQGKQGREKHKACKSASQTWAGAKACRMAFSFVAVLAGYEASTAEEVTGNAPESRTAAPQRQAQPSQGGRVVEGSKASSKGVCKKHDAQFARGKHPIHDEENNLIGWCNDDGTETMLDHEAEYEEVIPEE